eukprot:TRINITY_DN3923_c0_g1_i1.p1 TRINITY_DN3923_c0_g1~~TRINITY_DN3923_c0_g1_i1.p1  ORF type:complete len:151 (-),score=48.06 TRINITY_DN3923_c0_g1_i1:100-495(-)
MCIRDSLSMENLRLTEELEKLKSADIEISTLRSRLSILNTEHDRVLLELSTVKALQGGVITTTRSESELIKLILVSAEAERLHRIISDQETQIKELEVKASINQVLNTSSLTTGESLAQSLKRTSYHSERY